MDDQLVESCTEHKISVPSEQDEDHHPGRGRRVQRAQWLRAAILGANDGLLSTTSLMLGVGAAKEDRRSMIISGVAGAVAGACSMAVGEFVSVSTQRDIEQMGSSSSSSISSKKSSETDDPDLSQTKAKSPKTMLVKEMVKTQLGNNGESSAVTEAPAIQPSPRRSPMMRAIATAERREPVNKEEAGETLPIPIKAASASAVAFMAGSLVPLLSGMFVANYTARLVVLVVVTMISLATFGGVGARLGGSHVFVSAMRVLIGGCTAMGITYALLKPLDGDD